MNKINNIESFSKSYQSQTSKNIGKKNPQETDSKNTEAIIAHTKPALKAQNVDSAATEALEKAKTNASKAIEVSTSNLDEARIKALLED